MGIALDVCVEHRNKGVSSTKMQDDLPKYETIVGYPNEWRYSRTVGRHGDVLVPNELLHLQRAAHDQLVSRTPAVNSTTNPSLLLMQRTSDDSFGRRGGERAPFYRELSSRDANVFFQLPVFYVGR